MFKTRQWNNEIACICKKTYINKLKDAFILAITSSKRLSNVYIGKIAFNISLNIALQIQSDHISNSNTDSAAIGLNITGRYIELLFKRSLKEWQEII